jgi:predicted amidohydrolase
MRAGFYQYDVKNGDIEHNLRIIEESLADQNFELLVLPELCTSGYLFASKEEALMFSGADLICCPSNFGGSWSVNFAKIRALENLTYFITCNRTGEESKNGINVQFCGESQILDYEGQAIYDAGADEEIKLWDLEIRGRDQRDFVLAEDIYREREMYRNLYKQIKVNGSTDRRVDVLRHS